jgi:ABC-2 type transport system ATP-binding protein
MAKKGSMIIFSSHRMEHVEQFCKKLVVILRGKSVLEGDLKKIKESYRKKNIFVKGEIDIKEIEQIKGVLEVIEDEEQYIIKIESSLIVKDVFNKLSNNGTITKFAVEEPSLNEIFVEKVGENYDK